MQRLLSITLISITTDIYTQQRNIREHQGPQICGGRLKGPVGIIQTPNFPNPFPVPIKCRWIIEYDNVNGTISIFFTQQYTTSGLKFTEYMYYDESYKLGERKALTVTEENITRNNWLQEEACPGALGWVCAACWCAGCAALCAQPLLLQAELAGRRQSAPSIALLAGVCTLLWLTARMSGGAPLQLGTAAQAVCDVGCAMLAVLCFALAVCAALRLRSMTHKIPSERRTYLKDRQRLLRHTLAVLAATATWQPGPRTLVHVLALSIAALVNSACSQPSEYCSCPHIVIVKNIPLETHPLVGGEVESRGSVGMLESTSSQVSPVTSYWRVPGLESPSRFHRRHSTPDTRVDIVRCVEYKDSLLSPQRYNANVGGPHLGDSHMGTTHVSTAHFLCDPIPHLHTASQCPEYIAHVCLELGVHKTPTEPANPLLTCSMDLKTYTDRHFDTSKDGFSICAHSNPDVSKITSPPIKSCLKKTKPDFRSTNSLPSIELKEESKSKSDIEQVNREWNKAYEAPETDRMLNKISNDLEFLLNRTQDKSSVLDQIEETPT